jgi:hypothetical protein
LWRLYFLGRGASALRRELRFFLADVRDPKIAMARLINFSSLLLALVIGRTVFQPLGKNKQKVVDLSVARP